jgi:hypothetical protein
MDAEGRDGEIAREVKLMMIESKRAASQQMDGLSKGRPR